MNVSINGAQIYFTQTGPDGGVPIVLIHGFPFSHEMWSPQIEALKNDFRVIAYDVRGLGRSEAGDGQYMMEHFADDLIALLDHLKLAKVVACGLSMGGYIALRAIERNPERFAGLVLADTRAEADTNEGKLKRAAGIKSVKTGGVNAFAEGFLKAVFAPGTFTHNPQAVEKIRAIIEANSPLGICGAQIAMASRTDTSAALPKIAVPALVLVGEHDTLTPPAVSQTMAAQIPGAELKVIPQAAHMSNLENAAEFNAHLLSFLKRHWR